MKNIQGPPYYTSFINAVKMCSDSQSFSLCIKDCKNVKIMSKNVKATPGVSKKPQKE